MRLTLVTALAVLLSLASVSGTYARHSCNAPVCVSPKLPPICSVTFTCRPR